MAVQRIPVTPEGHLKLQEELRQLKSVDRPAVVKAIEEARGHGDLSENAEYDAAKEKQGFIEARIREIEDKLSRVDVIDPSGLRGEKVVFGATVTVYDVDTEEEQRFKIVGDDEADVTNGKVSVSSPMARALIGRTEGDDVRVKTPKGLRQIEIVKVEFV